MAQITNEKFKELYKEFKKLNELGTDSEFADFLNKKGFRPIDKGGSKKFTDKNVFARRKLLNLKSFLKAGTQNPTTIKTREKRNKVLTDLVNKANQGYKYVSPAQLSYLAEKKLGLDKLIEAEEQKMKDRRSTIAPKVLGETLSLGVEFGSPIFPGIKLLNDVSNLI